MGIGFCVSPKMADQGEAQVVWGWETFFTELATFLRLLEREEGVANLQFSQYALERLQVAIVGSSNVRNVFAAVEDDQSEVALYYQSAMTELVECLQFLSVRWENYHDSLLSSPPVMHTAYQAPIIQTGQRGRPRFDVTVEQLEYLSSLSFTWAKIARLLGISRMTLYRKRLEFGMLQRGTRIGDNELYVVIREMRVDFPDMGDVMVVGRIRSLGFCVSRDRVRRIIRSTDPLNTALRGITGRTSRRPYSVPGPNSLWHIDGHHKLVRWGLVTHGGIDGYSRLVTYLKCSTNNKASTVYKLFLQAVREFGLPSRVRSDQGRENILVAQHMLEHRGIGRQSIITGASTHNQRIERLWRDSHRCVTMLYYRLFYHLEHHNILDPTNDIHLYAIHYVYVPRINKALREFKEGWNNHPIRTENNTSPHQLFVVQSLQLQRSGLVALDFFVQVNSNYGIEEEGLVSDNSEGAEVPQVQFQLTEEHHTDLRQHVDPAAPSDCYGIDLYQRVLVFIYHIVSSHPDVYGELV